MCTSWPPNHSPLWKNWALFPSHRWNPCPPCAPFHQSQPPATMSLAFLCLPILSALVVVLVIAIIDFSHLENIVQTSPFASILNSISISFPTQETYLFPKCKPDEFPFLIKSLYWLPHQPLQHSDFLAYLRHCHNLTSASPSCDCH